MFASLTKLAGRTFLIGYCIPVLIFELVIAFLWGGWDLAKTVLGGDLSNATVNAVGLLFFTWTNATILLVFNYWIYRAMEGYVGPFKSAVWLEKQRVRWRSANVRVDTAEAKFTHPDEATAANARMEYLNALRDLATDFPDREKLLLPTCFGNRVRAFETYPYVVYGVDSIPTWLRLQGVMSKDAIAVVAEARCQVDFFVNLWLLSVAMAIAAGAAAAWSTTFGWKNFDSVNGTAYATCTISVVLAWLSYRGAVAMTVSWGDQVKSAFDLYLPVLAKQLGFQIPRDPVEARKFWRAINEMFLYCRPIDTLRWPRTESASSVSASGAAASKGGDDNAGQ